MKRVFVTHNRNFDYDGQMMGRGGTYDISDRSARVLVDMGRVKVVEDLGKDAEEPFFNETPKMGKSEFLALVEEHGDDLMEILQRKMEDKYKKEIESGADDDISRSKFVQKESGQSESEGAKGGDETIAPNVQDASGANSVSAKTNESGSEGGNEQPEGGNETGGNEGGNEEIVEGTPIPKGFPGITILKEANITTLEAIPTDKDELLKAVPELSERAAVQIGVKLEELKKEQEG